MHTSSKPSDWPDETLDGSTGKYARNEGSAGNNAPEDEKQSKRRRADSSAPECYSGGYGSAGSAAPTERSRNGGSAGSPAPREMEEGGRDDGSAGSPAPSEDEYRENGEDEEFQTIRRKIQ